MTLAYYNDRFDLKPGDLVYVDGKLAGLRGRVTAVSYSFKIKLSAYQRVIAKLDTDVHGEFRFIGSHVVTFDRNALSVERVRAWFLAPDETEDETVCGADDAAFRLDELHNMHADDQVMERGHKYYMENKVRFICVDEDKGYAIVEGSRPYEVEFCYRDGEISNLTCSCYCSTPCKHEFAAMLQLRESFDRIADTCIDELERTGYCAIMSKGVLFGLVMDGRTDGGFTL